MKNKNLILLFIASFIVSFLHGQDLDSILQQAYDQNPELKALQLQYEAALKKGPQESQLPNPTIGVGVPILPPETRLGSQVFTVSASQMFPWFGTLDAREDVVLTIAKSKYENIVAERLNIDYQIKTAYLQLYLIERKQAIINQNIRLIQTLEQVAVAKVESGNAIASDVLIIKLKIEELTNQLDVLEEQRTGFTARINALRMHPFEELIQLDTTKLSLAQLEFDIEYYAQKIKTNHPLIKQIDWQMEKSTKELALNELVNMPSFGVSLDYSIVNARTDAIPANNGRDILIPKVMVTLPIYRKAYEARKEEEKLKQSSFEFKKENAVQKMIGDIYQFKSEYESAKLLYELSKKQMDISNSAYDILLSAYSSKGNRFDELLKLQSEMTRYEIEMLQSIVQSHIAKFKIERLTNF